MLEICDRNDRSKNVLLYNVPESLAKSADERVIDDLTHVSSILEPLGAFQQPKKIFRIGPPKPNAVRPLKMIFSNNDEAKSILKSNVKSPNKQNHFRPDLTTRQRQSNSSIIEKFKERKSRGENDIALTYRNNMALITRRNEGRSQAKNEYIFIFTMLAV